jgi:hypothetical protein
LKSVETFSIVGAGCGRFNIRKVCESSTSCCFTLRGRAIPVRRGEGEKGALSWRVRNELLISARNDAENTFGVVWFYICTVKKGLKVFFLVLMNNENNGQILKTT